MAELNQPQSNSFTPYLVTGICDQRCDSSLCSLAPFVGQSERLIWSETTYLWFQSKISSATAITAWNRSRSSIQTTDRIYRRLISLWWSCSDLANRETGPNSWVFENKLVCSERENDDSDWWINDVMWTRSPVQQTDGFLRNATMDMYQAVMLFPSKALVANFRSKTKADSAALALHFV